MTFRSLSRLNAKISKSNVNDIPNIRDFSHPLTFGWFSFLIRQSLISTELVAIGERHLNESLTEVNKRDSIFYLNHTYTITQKIDSVKGFFTFFYIKLTLVISD